ncbi:MAG TPA: hypothetical protein VI756_25805 [Blastocatellia bacterium]
MGSAFTITSSVGFIQAMLFSLDTGAQLDFDLQPSEFEWKYEVGWEESGVIYGSPAPIEYRKTSPLEMTINANFDAYYKSGMSGSIAQPLNMIYVFSQRVPGRNRSHILQYMQGATTFVGVLRRASVKVRRLNSSGGPLQALGAEIMLEEIVWNGV